MAAAHPVDGERVLFGAIAGKYLFRCPGCDACVSTEVDTPCSPVCAGLAKKATRRRRGGAAEGGEPR